MLKSLHHWFPELLFLSLLVAVLPLRAQEGDVRRVHDPFIIRVAPFDYIFSTGPGIPIRQSKDLVHWKQIGSVFSELPTWIRSEFHSDGYLWAPSVLYFNKGYHLYYAVSTFGSNRSCIALATNVTLSPDSADYKWVDQGKVIESTKGDDWNAIDPNPVMDERNNLWLCYGSFWSGIKLRRLDPVTGKLFSAYPTVYSLAKRPPPGAVEAAHIIRHGGYYYLFVSFDFCAMGVKSTYNIRVGRSREVTGPYSDSHGVAMMAGGGSQVLASQGSTIGPGHNSILSEGGKEWIVHHFYDGEARGIPTLQIRPLTWTFDGWPVAGEPLTAPPPTNLFSR
jgi:arabinan endo-1,5-alpha-L-arabinosidase